MPRPRQGHNIQRTQATTSQGGQQGDKGEHKSKDKMKKMKHHTGEDNKHKEKHKKNHADTVMKAHREFKAEHREIKAGVADICCIGPMDLPPGTNTQWEREDQGFQGIS